MFPEQMKLTSLRRLEFLELRGDMGLEAHALDDLRRVQTLEDSDEAQPFGVLVEIEQGLGGHHPPGPGPPGCR